MVKAHGLRGEVLIFLHTDLSDRFKKGRELATSEGRSLMVASARTAENGLLVRFDEIRDRNDAEALGKTDLFIRGGERRPLGEDEYWPDELIGLEVRDGDGNVLGVVVDVDDTTPQARLVMRTPGGDHLIPLVTALVPTVSMSDGFLVLRPVPGLLD